MEGVTIVCLKDKNEHYLCQYQAEQIKQLQAKLKPLQEFTRKIIKEGCWENCEVDGGDLQDMAEKIGLIKSVEATEDDIDEDSDFEVGDIIFKFTDILKEN